MPGSISSSPPQKKPAPSSKGAQKEGNEGKSPKKRGWDEIESLFDDKKKKKAEVAVAKAESAKKYKSKPSGERSGKVEAKQVGGDWVDDGLGGVYNSEGFTGRVEDGVRVFKAHVIQQSPNAGQTDQCPFDCNCCYM
eukprot:scaffold11639_cov172-Amphora_coffeaeformis.AAC.10